MSGNVSSHRMEVEAGMNNNGQQRLFQAEPIAYRCAPQLGPRQNDSNPKTRPFGAQGFANNDKQYVYGNSQIEGAGVMGTSGSEGSEEDEEEDDDDDEEMMNREGMSKAVTIQNPSTLGMFLPPSSTISFLNPFSPSGAPGLSHPEGNMAKESGLSREGFARSNCGSVQEYQRIPHGSSAHSESMPVAGSVPDEGNYYTHLLQSSVAHERGEGAVAESSEPSLRSILSDPLTGALMDDATILSCGHSFGSGGLRHVLEANACISCYRPVTNDSMAPNHALRAAVRAYRREEEYQSMSSRSAKRRREKLEQDKTGFGEQTSMDSCRGKGVQFPFVVGDRVIIKGNKRTPERFVGREAIITTQCLNGWYVVRTLDNSESVKLQYRSLIKVGDQQLSNEIPHKIVGPSWL